MVRSNISRLCMVIALKINEHHDNHSFFTIAWNQVWGSIYFYFHLYFHKKKLFLTGSIQKRKIRLLAFKNGICHLKMASTPLYLFTFRPVTHTILDALTPTYQHLLPFSNKNTIINLTKLLEHFAFKLESILPPSIRKKRDSPLK